MLSQQGPMLFGDSGTLLRLMVLAFGGAMLVGNGVALVRSRPDTPDGELTRAPLARTLVMAGVGAIATIWALISLVA